MITTPLLLAATSDVLVFVGAAVAVALLLLYQLRLQKRFDEVESILVRVERAQKEGSLDARKRIEEATRAIDALEQGTMPRLAGLEPHVTDLGRRLEELEARVREAHPRVEEAARGSTEALEAVGALRDAATRVREGAGRMAELESQVRDLRGRLDGLQDVLEPDRGALEARIEEIVRRLGDEGPVRATASRPLAAASADAPAAGAGDVVEIELEAGEEEEATPIDAHVDEAELEAQALAATPEPDTAADTVEREGPGAVPTLLAWLVVIAGLTLLIHWISTMP